MLTTGNRVASCYRTGIEETHPALSGGQRFDKRLLCTGTLSAPLHARYCSPAVLFPSPVVFLVCWKNQTGLPPSGTPRRLREQALRILPLERRCQAQLNRWRQVVDQVLNQPFTGPALAMTAGAATGMPPLQRRGDRALGLSVYPLNTTTSALFRATVQLRPSGWHRSGRPCSHPAGRTGAVHRPARVAGPGRRRRFVRYAATAGVSIPARWRRPRRLFRGGGGGRHGLRRQGDIGAQPPAGGWCAWTPPQGRRC